MHFWPGRNKEDRCFVMAVTDLERANRKNVGDGDLALHLRDFASLRECGKPAKLVVI